jgi:prepilin-type N-terminal cleavage/methylation domain-containing protein
LIKEIAVKCKESGFTLIELLTVMAIISLLVALLVPALNMVRKLAKETSQKAQLSSIDEALLGFRNDYGDYPPSDEYSRDTGVADYCGAQKLAEALLGRDLLGFHPRSTWSATDPTWYPPAPPNTNLDQRKERYLELATTDAFRLGISGPGMNDGLFRNTATLHPDRFVLCDVFRTKEVTLPPAPGGRATILKAGLPILYYRADVSNRAFNQTGIPPGANAIYHFLDNYELVRIADLEDGTPLGDHPLTTGGGTYFYSAGYKIMDQKVLNSTGRPWPHRPDSYILISAGADGRYGTSDDITNFGN